MFFLKESKVTWQLEKKQSIANNPLVDRGGGGMAALVPLALLNLVKKNGRRV